MPRPNRVTSCEGRLTFVWTNDWSFAELLQRCATLPADSAIFYGVLTLDANGVPQIEERTLRELHAVANAPIFGLHSTQLGRGIVGGPLLSIEDLSRSAANVALRVLRGESPLSIVTPTQVAGVPAFDWRELERWGIGEDRLDPGSTVQFREPTTWQRYQGPVIAVGGLTSGLALIVIALAANVVKQRRVERSLRQSEEVQVRGRSGDARRGDRALMLSQNLERAVVGQRAIEKVALGELARQLFEPGRLIGGLDALGRDVHRQA